MELIGLLFKKGIGALEMNLGSHFGLTFYL